MADRRRRTPGVLVTTLGVVSLIFVTGVRALEPINPKAGHVERWNWFFEAVYDLHQRVTAGRKLREERSMGGYMRLPGFYEEVRYFDAANGRLLSLIQWEREKPDRVHFIDVYVYDAAGRLVRDYGVAFLPNSRTAPQQTFINLHAYNNGLTAFRQFDATDNRIYETCKGTYEGRKIDLKVWERDLIGLDEDAVNVFELPEYKACFAGLPETSAGEYLTPQ